MSNNVKFGVFAGIAIIVFALVVVIIPPKPEVQQTPQKVERVREKTMSNDEIIAEVKKCESAGMKGFVRWWVSDPKTGATDGVAEVVCLPKEECSK
jgi:hypothetical protein